MSHLHHRVSALVDGELSPGARRRALAHARSCSQCRHEIEETLELKQRLGRLDQVDMSGDLLAFVRSGAPEHARDPLPDDVAPAQRSRFVRRALVGVGGVSAVLIGAAYVVGTPAPVQARAVNPPVAAFSAEFADNTGLAPFSDPAVGGLAAGSPVDHSGTAVTLGGGADQAAGAPKTAAPAPQPQSVGDDQPRALALLRRAVQAPQRYGYDGVRMIRSFTTEGSRSFRVLTRHSPDQGTAFLVLGLGGTVRYESFVPESARVKNGLEGKPIGPLEAAYQLAVIGSARVDGRTATVVSARRDGQVRARFWIDDATGLLLRRALFVNDRLVRWSGFITLHFRADSFMSHLPPEMETYPDYTLSTSVAAALNDKGWACPERLASYFHLSFVHQLEAGSNVMHVEYTDGLSTVSLFEEHGTLDTSQLWAFQARQVGDDLVYVRDGLPTVAVWQSGEKVFTVVTDAPDQLLGSFVAHLPHSVAAEPGIADRIGSGLSRIAGALTP